MPIPHRKQIKKDLIELLKANGPISTEKAYFMLQQTWSLTQLEMDKKRGDRPKYENEIRWARQELLQEGILEKSDIAGRGIWKLRSAIIVPPEEYEEEFNTKFAEGKPKQITVNSYERNPKAREMCLLHHGYSCAACGFDFEVTYGEAGKGCIHVHHLVQISLIGKSYEIDPIKDLIPVCPNCYYILHRHIPPFSIDEIKAMLKYSKLKSST